MTGIIAVLVAGAGMDAGEQVPAATVTQLLVGIERLAQRAESGPEAMTAATARLEVVAGQTIARHRPAVGWLSLTPAERDVARLVAEGLASKEIGARLFVSPRTVQTHLTHMYGKLGVTSRVQLGQLAARHA